MQSLDSLYSQTIPVNFHNRAMRQKCLEFIIYMFITKWDKENLQTCSCYMIFSEWASRETEWDIWTMICGFLMLQQRIDKPISYVCIDMFPLVKWSDDQKKANLGLELTSSCCLHDNWVGLACLERWDAISRCLQASQNAGKKYGALNCLLRACEMLRAYVKFNEVFPSANNFQLADKLNRSALVGPGCASRCLLLEVRLLHQWLTVRSKRRNAAIVWITA